MPRPAADVVVPFAGRDDALGDLLHRLAALRTSAGDTVTVVDNRRRARRPAPPDGVGLVEAAGTPSSYSARNAGARRGAAPWIVFLDDDVEAPADLLDRLLDPPPNERTGVIAGGVRDEEPGPGAPAAVRYAWLKRSMDQAMPVELGFAQTANCAVRRSAFDAAGGFREGIRSGGDADLCLRLRTAGWELERRDAAAVVHRSRRTVRALLAQRAKHGAGAAWVDAEHPGSLPARSLPGVAWWALRRGAQGVRALAAGDRDAALTGLLDGPAVLAYELGRRRPNDAR